MADDCNKSPDIIQTVCSCLLTLVMTGLVLGIIRVVVLLVTGRL